jgi:mannose-1-phosphate guanylyltransferase/MurNAc alpha-1-phosphate uridylyltransferase
VLAVPAGPPAEFGDLRFAGFSLLPPDLVSRLPVQKAELVGTVWRPAERAGRLELISTTGATSTPVRRPTSWRRTSTRSAMVRSIAADAVVTGEVEPVSRRSRRDVAGSRTPVRGVPGRAGGGG